VCCFTAGFFHLPVDDKLSTEGRFFYKFFCTLGFFAGASTPCVFPRMIDGWLANVNSPVSTEKKRNKLPGVSGTMYISILHMMHSISAVGVFVILILY
jgi:hypothetical protein